MKKLFLACLFLLPLVLRGQDFHFSQFYNAPLHLNPALTGVYDFGFWKNDFRASGIYRDQWRSIPSAYLKTATPFKTTAFSADMKIRSPRILDMDFIGAGISFFNDKSGDLDFRTMQVNWSLSYNKALNFQGTRFLSAGFRGGISQRTIDYTRAAFDSQWTGTDYDPSLPTGEYLSGTGYSYADFGGGLVFSSVPANRLNLIAGVAVAHFNRPYQSFQESRWNTSKSFSVTLYPAFSAHGSARIPLRDGKALNPSLLYLRQGPAGELNVTNYLQLQPFTKDKMNYQLGLGYRIVGHFRYATASEALIGGVKLWYNNFIFTFSYDANISSLRKASRTIGGFEVSLIYFERFFHKHDRYRDQKRRPRCPRFKRAGDSEGEWEY